ncbi:MAG TPA: tetratricopeptide repeat protein, partial [Polyangia bacterium]
MSISRRSSIAAATLSLALAGGSLAQPVGDDDEAPAVEAGPPRTAGKPVPFERAWLEPFFQHGPAKQAAEKFRGEDWEAAETGFSKALKSLPRGSDERLAASYLLALARADQSNWADAGKLFEALFDSYPKLAPYHAYNAARCRLRRGDYPGALEWAAKVAPGTVPEAEADLIRIDALRSLYRWDEAVTAIDAHLKRFPGGPRHAEVLYKKAEATEKARAGKEAAPTQEVIDLYRRVWAEAPLEAWSERAGDRLEQIANALPSPEAAVVRGHGAAALVTRGMVFFDHNRNQESESAFAAALGAP